MILKGKKIFLRPTLPSDVRFIYNLENDKENWKVSETQKPFTKKQIEDFVLNQKDIYIDKQLRLMICLPSQTNNTQDQAIGCIDLFEFDELALKAGIGIIIEKKYRRKGYASDALSQVIKYCFNALSLHHVFCNIFQNNKASIKLFQKQKFSIMNIQKGVYSLHLLNKNITSNKSTKIKFAN
jgi:diamine N-acetyltransferase